MMLERYLKIGSEKLYYRHNNIRKGRKTLLFVHGLGDSGLSFEDVFQDNRFEKYNLIVPDLVGYGRSSDSENKKRYGYATHLERLWKLIHSNRLNDLIVIGHSMGGDLTTLLCDSDKRGIIRKYVNIEGDITQYDLTISSAAVKAFNNNIFDRWFEEGLKRRIVHKSLGHLRSGRIYLASLSFCRKEVFLDNAFEVVRRNMALKGKYGSEIGRIYCGLSIPTMYCYGTKSLSKESLAFLKENNMPVRAFRGIGHCPMTDSPDEFYSFLYKFIQS